MKRFTEKTIQFSLQKNLDVRITRASWISLILIACFLCFTNLSYSQGGHLQPTDLNWFEITKLPSSRITYSVNHYDGKIYVIGGEGGEISGGISRVSIYDIETDEWSEGTNMPTPRPLAPNITIANKIYAIGGNKQSLASGHKLEVYDVLTDTWETLTDMPTSRVFPAAAVINGKIYVMGGFSQSGLGGSQSGKAITVVERYDPHTDEWDSCAMMTTARFNMQASAINNKIYTYGGDSAVNTNYNGSDKVEEYDPIADQWTLKTSMHFQRSDFASLVIEDKIYAFAGSPDAHISSSYSHFEVYDPGSDVWTLSTNEDSIPNGALGAAYVDGEIYLVGGLGSTGGLRREVYVYNPRILTVTSNPETIEESLTAIIHEDCKIYIVPDGTTAKLDSILEDAIVSFDATVSDEYIIPLSGLEEGNNYLVYGVSEDQRVDLNCFVLGFTDIIPDFTMDQIIVYPNPTCDNINIETPIFSNYSIEIHSLNGQLLFKTEMEGNSRQIDLSHFSKGIYFVSLRSDTCVRTEKVVKL